jgi:hypothetical protein
VKADIGVKIINDWSRVDLTDEMNFTHDVSDEALEAAASSVRERAGAFTLHSALAWTPARVKPFRLLTGFWFDEVSATRRRLRHYRR